MRSHSTETDGATARQISSLLGEVRLLASFEVTSRGLESLSRVSNNDEPRGKDCSGLIMVCTTTWQSFSPGQEVSRDSALQQAGSYRHMSQVIISAFNRRFRVSVILNSKF